MDKSDSSSDSDSSSSTSWVFVEDAAKTSTQITNTFHLDCSREPVQELTEQDLASNCSDFESDTDGISVISESEVPPEEATKVEELATSTITKGSLEGITSVETISELSTSQTAVAAVNESTKKHFKPLHLLGVGIALIAVVCSLYNQEVEKDKVNFEFSTLHYENRKAMVSESGPQKDHVEGKGINADLDQIVDITLTCAFRYKPTDKILNNQIKRCVKKEYEVMNSKNEFIDEEIKENRQSVLEEDPEMNKIEKNKYRNLPVLQDTNENAEQHKHKKRGQHEIDKTKNEKKAKYDCAGDTSHKEPKNKKPNQKVKSEKPKKDDSKHSKKHKETYNEKCTHKHNKKNYKNEYKPQKVAKDHESDKKYFNKMNRFKSPITITLKQHNPREEKPSKQKNFKNFTYFPRLNTTGEWYSNLHKARKEMRKQEHVSDWVFDRAHGRSKKRNKAQWYFKWMNIREQLRYKHSYKPYSS